jgi:hypothetical protein
MDTSWTFLFVSRALTFVWREVIQRTVGKKETTFRVNTTKVVMKTPVCWDITSHSVFVRSVEHLGSKAYQNNVKSEFLALRGKKPPLQLRTSYRCLGQLPLFGTVTAVYCESHTEHTDTLCAEKC